MSISTIPLTIEPPGAEEPAPPVRVALVNMPFALADRPSIQCGLLKACLTRQGHAVDVHYLNLELAAELGADTYPKLGALRSEQLLGEWLFSVAAFGYRPDEADYRATFSDLQRTCEEAGVSFEEICRLRNEVFPALIERWATSIDWGQYAIVGFSSMFEQNAAALALARAIKDRHPQVITVFGGANFDGEMGPEYVRAFPWIDYAVVGEGDAVFPQLVGRIARGESGAGMHGVVARVNGAVVQAGSAPLLRNMDSLPYPDYDEYFSTLFRLGREQVLGLNPPMLLFESSRGCWWGQKHHCTFCGLNNDGMSYRSKSPERVLDELRRLTESYQISNFEAVDNIMDMRYLDQVCCPIGDEHYDYHLFYEVKANLTRAQLKTMAHAGVSMIQPGIESLNTHILTLMRKGTTMLRNVRVLKWARYYGIEVGWNLLSGFPGEAREDYEAQRRLIPLIAHLQPAQSTGRIWLERFSPYFFDPSFPVRNVRPTQAYRFIYPEDRIDLEKIAYYFDYEMDGVLPIEEYEHLRAVLDEWKARWEQPIPPMLVYQRAPDWIQIVDRRDASTPNAFALHGVEAAAYEFCGETDRPPAQVATYLNESHGADLDPATVGAMLQRFCDMGLMIQEDGHFLSLALPTNPYI